METDVHLFLECPMAKAIWFGCRWSLRSEKLNLSNCEEIPKFAEDPLSYSPAHAQKNEDLNTQWIVQVALTLETLWF